MNFFRKLFAVMLLAFGLTGLAAPAVAEEATVLSQMYAWWNDAFHKEDGFTREGFARYYTEDAVIKINGEVAVQGLDNLVTHFRKIQSNSDHVAVELPFIEEFVSKEGDKIFTHHIMAYRRNGEEGRMPIMGYVVLKDGKIALFDLVRSGATFAK